MDRSTVLAILLSLHSSCFGSHLFDSYGFPPDQCIDERVLKYQFTKILVTTTETLAPISEIITLPPVMSHISVAGVTEELPIWETLTQPPVIIPVDHSVLCTPVQPLEVELTTIRLTTTLTAAPIIKLEPIKQCELESVAPVKVEVTLTKTLDKEVKTHPVTRLVTNTVVEPLVTVMETISVTTTVLLPPIVKTERRGRTVEDRPNPVTEQHANVTMMSPPEVKITTIDVTRTNIPPAVSKMVMATTTTRLTKACGEDYHTHAPHKAFEHGRGQPSAEFDLNLPIASH